MHSRRVGLVVRCMFTDFCPLLDNFVCLTQFGFAKVQHTVHGVAIES